MTNICLWMLFRFLTGKRRQKCYDKEKGERADGEAVNFDLTKQEKPHENDDR
jgi:hypothetical protein